jgi:hypothetical protein
MPLPLKKSIASVHREALFHLQVSISGSLLAASGKRNNWDIAIALQMDTAESEHLALNVAATCQVLPALPSISRTVDCANHTV